MTSISITRARNGFFNLFDKVVRDHETIVIDRRGKDKVAMVPISDLERLQRLEDLEDIEAADAAVAESAERIPYEEIRADLGL